MKNLGKESPWWYLNLINAAIDNRLGKILLIILDGVFPKQIFISLQKFRKFSTLRYRTISKSNNGPLVDWSARQREATEMVRSPSSTHSSGKNNKTNLSGEEQGRRVFVVKGPQDGRADVHGQRGHLLQVLGPEQTDLAFGLPGKKNQHYDKLS